jgi:hypothetical protein
MERRAALFARFAVLALAFALPAGARADGLPLPTDYSTPDGVAAVDGVYRYVTLPAGSGTIVERVTREGGRVVASRFLHGGFTVPVVALNGTAGGLSHDGSTLVLIRPRTGFPRRSTPMLFLDTHRLAVRGRVTLPGDFSFDAISPDGRSIYLIHYQSKADPTKYEVRSLDVSSGRLRPHAVVDPRERDEQMQGYPLARAISPDGRWDYTLYGGTGKPFIHALDTTGNTARCVDLPWGPADGDVYSMHLRLSGSGRSLTVVGPKGVSWVMDTSTFRVSAPAASKPVAPVHGGEGGGSGSWLAWLPAACGVALAAAALAARIRRFRRRPLESTAARGDVRVVKGDGL